MSDFSLDLNEDQLQIQKWVHDFAENVVRPAGPRVGRAGRDAVARSSRRRPRSGCTPSTSSPRPSPTRPACSMCLVNEEMSWGDAGIALAIFGSTLAVAGIFANGTPEQIGEWIPQCFGTPDDIKLAAFGVSEPDAGSDVSLAASRGPSTTRPRTSGCSTAPRPGSPTAASPTPRARALGRPRAGQPGPGQLRRARGHAGDLAGPEVQEDGHPRLAHRRGRPRRLPRPGALPARRQGEARRAPGPGQGGQADVDARPPWPPSRRPGRSSGAQAVGIARAAYEYSLDYAKERKQFGRAIIENQAIAFKLADMKMRTDAVPAAGAAGGLDGARRARSSRTARARCRSSTPARTRCG